MPLCQRNELVKMVQVMVFFHWLDQNKASILDLCRLHENVQKNNQYRKRRKKIIYFFSLTIIQTNVRCSMCVWKLFNMCAVYVCNCGLWSCWDFFPFFLISFNWERWLYIWFFCWLFFACMCIVCCWYVWIQHGGIIYIADFFLLSQFFALWCFAKKCICALSLKLSIFHTMRFFYLNAVYMA